MEDMKKRALWMGGCVAAAVLVAGSIGVQTSMSGPIQTAAVAGRADNFRLADQNLMAHELYELKDASAVVIVTHVNGDAASRATAAGLKALQDRYDAKGVEFMLLNSEPTVTREQIAAEVAAAGFTTPILMDTNQLVGEQLEVTRGAEVIVINPKTWRIVYRGPLGANNAWAIDGIEAAMADRTAAVAKRAATGRVIAFPERDRRAEFAKIAYATDIAPIFQEKCVSCHQPGGIGPMPLTSYERIKGFSPMIRETVRMRRMPPYHADPSVGKFHDDKSLSPTQIKTLIHWIEAGSPRGAGVDPLASIDFRAPEWPLGKPDLVLDIPAYAIPASGVVDYQRPYLVNPLTEARWLRASTVKVANRQAVHHILTGLMPQVPASGRASETTWGSSVGGYAVGSESVVAPKNAGTYVPAGGAIGFQNHYTPFGKPVTESSQIALYFYPKNQAPDLVMHNISIADQTISIPPNTKAHPEVAYVTFPQEAIIYGVFPHAHYRGRSAQVWLRTPDGKEELLVAVPKYDFNWQREYEFATPIKVPAGSKLINRYTFDNSTRNPANPDANRTVPWGDQSFDEMLFTQVRYRWVDETSSNLKPQYEQALSGSRMFGMLDDNIDGKLARAELKGSIGQRLVEGFAVLDANKDGFLDPAEVEAGGALLRRQQASR